VSWPASRDASVPRALVTDPSLSVVVPVFNEARHIRATLDALLVALARSPFTAELIVVDDGSTDGSGDMARDAVDGRVPVEVVRQPNRGRLLARRAGLQAAAAPLVLLLDGRVRLEQDALAFVHTRVLHGEEVWTGHVNVEAPNAFGRFWRLLAELAWRDYFDEPRTTSFGAAEFDRYPKGTTCFLAPRELLLRATVRFESRYTDPRSANDDTPILRELASARDIHVSPEFACTYSPRAGAAAFFRHAVHRGVVFLDGHGVPESRFFPAAVVFFPASAALVTAAWRRPWLVPAALAGCGVGAAAYALHAGRSREDARALALATPLYAVGHGLGMWKGLGQLLAARLR
jgi:glycosyltransferase involved in cell wall biosynthesis